MIDNNKHSNRQAWRIIIFLEMGEIWKDQDEKLIVTRKMTPLLKERKQKFLLLRCVLALFLYVHPQSDQQN